MIRSRKIPGSPNLLQVVLLDKFRYDTAFGTFLKDKNKWRFAMVLTTYHPILSLIAGILILIMPRLLNYIVAIYLIITGLVGLIR